MAKFITELLVLNNFVKIRQYYPLESILERYDRFGHVWHMYDKYGQNRSNMAHNGPIWPVMVKDVMTSLAK